MPIMLDSAEMARDRRKQAVMSPAPRPNYRSFPPLWPEIAEAAFCCRAGPERGLSSFKQAPHATSCKGDGIAWSFNRSKTSFDSSD